MGAQGSQQDPVSLLEPLPSGLHGIPASFGSPWPGSGAGCTDRAPASSWAGWIQSCCSALPWAFYHGKVLQPGSVGAGETEMLLELHCCYPRASSCCFVTGFGGAGGKSVDLPLPCQAQGTSHPLVLIPPALGGTQGWGHLGSGCCWEGGMVVKRRGCLWAHTCVQHS